MERNIFKDRRSITFFDKEKKIDDNLLKDIINQAVLAPSAYNLQPWRLIAVKSDDAKQRLCNLAFKQQKILDAPVTLIVVGEYEGYSENNPEWQKFLDMVKDEAMVKQSKEGATFLYGSTPERKIKFAESNSGILAMSIMYSAMSYGVESHAMSGMDFDGVKKEFNLEEDEGVVMLIALGYFDDAQELYPRRGRLLYDDIVEEV